jgi:hypothetical protein
MNDESTAAAEDALDEREVMAEPPQGSNDHRKIGKRQDMYPQDGEKPGARTTLQPPLDLQCKCDKCSGKLHPKLSHEQITEHQPDGVPHSARSTTESSEALNCERKAHGGTLKSNRKQVTDRSSREAALEKELKHWKSRHSKLKGYCKGLEDDYKKLDSTKKQLETKCKQLESICRGLRKTQEEENAKAILAVEERTSERDLLKSKLLELQAQHVRSVNSVGTGLENISDLTFKDNFRAQHDKVHQLSLRPSFDHFYCSFSLLLSAHYSPAIYCLTSHRLVTGAGKPSSRKARYVD